MEGRAQARAPQTETGSPTGGSMRAQGGAREELLPCRGLVGRAWPLGRGSSVGSRGTWSLRTLGSPGSRSGDTEGRGSVQRSQRKQATQPALPSGFPCLHGLRGCLAAPHPLLSPDPSIRPSVATGTLPCLAPAWSPPPLRRLCLGAPRTEARSWPGVVPSQPPHSNCPAGLHCPRGRVSGQAQPRLFPELGTSPDSGLPESRGMRRQTSSQPAQSRDPHLGQCAGHRRRQAVGGSWSSGPPSLSREAPCHGGRWLLAVA
ncbi:unnamed protein product [Rangifer tarandus platyrhynchus]|uniref:Uncharacterized protein n=1 Tax=Rangifer tarandus platyrhynchus TaxID=3082113 RepID=A0ABN8ZG02_RANTA|nr:unnamed protein product [Rangifer tarandus platyrhynchus]